MTSSTLFCESCGRLLFPGAALRVIERRTGRWSAICRPFVRPSCVRQTPSVRWRGSSCSTATQRSRLTRPRKDQGSSMTLIGVNRSRTPQPIRIEQFEPLGRYGGFDYFRGSGGKIYGAFDGRSDSTDAWSLADDEILISEPKFIEDDGRKLEMGLSYRRAFPIPADTFAALVESNKAPHAAKDNANRVLPVDGLDRFPLLDARSDYIVAQPATAMSSAAVFIDGDPPPADDPIRRGYVAGRGRARGREAIMQRIAETGAKVGISSTGAVTVEAPGGRLMQDVRDVIRAVEPIILGDRASTTTAATIRPRHGRSSSRVTPRASGTRSASSGCEAIEPRGGTRGTRGRRGAARPVPRPRATTARTSKPARTAVRSHTSVTSRLRS
jgi:hypothetical protein